MSTPLKHELEFMPGLQIKASDIAPILLAEGTATSSSRFFNFQDKHV
jgi:hypothetical protein